MNRMYEENEIHESWSIFTFELVSYFSSTCERLCLMIFDFKKVIFSYHLFQFRYLAILEIISRIIVYTRKIISNK